MLVGSKQEHDLIIEKTLDKVTKMELERNLLHRDPFTTWHDAYGHLLEELEETQKALEVVVQNSEILKKAIFRKFNNSDLIKQAEIVSLNALFVMNEALHVRAAALKAVEQLKNAHTDGNQ